MKKFVKPSSSVLKASSILLGLLLGLVCCKKKIEDPVAPELSSVKELSIAEADLNSIFGDVDSIVAYNSVSFGKLFKRDTLMKNYNKFIELYYQNAVKLGTTRTGNVKCFYTGDKKIGNYRDSVIFENTRINGRHITGYFSTIQKPDPFNLKRWLFDFNTAGYSENSNGDKIKFETDNNAGKYTKVKVGIVTGDSINGKTGDIWYSTGSWSGTDSKGQFFLIKNASTLNLSNPSSLVIKTNCSYHVPVQGVQDFFNASQNINYRIKFGDGECNAYASYLNEKGLEYIFFIE